MASGLESWPRLHFEGPGGRPFLFFVVFGDFPTSLKIDADSYCTLGVPSDLTLSRYRREEHPDVLLSFEEGYLWDELLAQDPELAQQVSGSVECLILRGELADRADLDYLRDSVGLLTWLLDHGGVGLYDPQMFRWWRPDAWCREAFEPAGPVPRRHVVVLTSDEDQPGPRGERLTWFHTRGMRKFGRPDLSVHGVLDRYHEPIVDLFERFIELQALGGLIAEGQEIRIRSLPPGMSCHHGGDPDDPDFNNVHVEITPPR